MVTLKTGHINACFPLDKMTTISADDIFKCIFINENCCISIQISLKFVLKGPIDHKSALVQVMAWCQTASKHYLNQCWPNSLTHICSTRGRWVKVTSGAHFTNNFSITIQMWWKFHFAPIQILIKWSLQYLAHGTTAGLSWHVPNFVAIWSSVIE